MVNEALVQYIKNTLEKGYTDEQLRTYLIQSGYQQTDVDEAFSALKPQTPSKEKISKKTILMIIAIVVSLGVVIAVGFILFSGNGGEEIEEADLTFSIKVNTKTINPGEMVGFKLNANNRGGGSTGVTIENQIIDSAGSVVLTDSDFFYVSGSINKPYNMQIPTDLEEGTYTIKTKATYNEEATEKSASFTVSKEKSKETDTGKETSKEETCYDGIKNQGETGADCGGPCLACEESAGCENCEDNDECTTDSCVNNTCVNEVKTPCCGNNKCEEGENHTTCSSDCEGMPKEYEERAKITEVLDSVGEVAKTDLDEAWEICNDLNESTDKDSCYFNVATSVDDAQICSEIEGISRADECYLAYASKIQDYSVCPSIQNNDLRNTCTQFEQLYKVA